MCTGSAEPGGRGSWAPLSVLPVRTMHFCLNPFLSFWASRSNAPNRLRNCCGKRRRLSPPHDDAPEAEAAGAGRRADFLLEAPPIIGCAPVWEAVKLTNSTRGTTGRAVRAKVEPSTQQRTGLCLVNTILRYQSAVALAGCVVHFEPQNALHLLLTPRSTGNSATLPADIPVPAPIKSSHSSKPIPLTASSRYMASGR